MSLLLSASQIEMTEKRIATSKAGGTTQQQLDANDVRLSLSSAVLPPPSVHINPLLVAAGPGKAGGPVCEDRNEVNQSQARSDNHCTAHGSLESSDSRDLGAPQVRFYASLSVAPMNHSAVRRLRFFIGTQGDEGCRRGWLQAGGGCIERSCETEVSLCPSVLNLIQS